ncbi:MAG TPA: PPC domain-containing protein [Verrucomicrobiales bacterium]|nr:PPC domain-containing protein [Verrucomicrobiales bacterium]
MSGRLLLFLLLAPAAIAQLPTARLDGLFPQGGRIGSEVEITIEGSDLEGVKELLFDHPGLKATPVEGTKFKLTIAADVPAGLHEVRVSGRYGISTSAVFVAGKLLEAKDNGANRSRAAAMPLTLPVTVNGICEADAADFYRFTATKDQRITVDCAAQRIDSPLSAVLSLSNADGQEIAARRISMDRDPAFDFTAPAEGEYTLGIHDLTWRGGSPYHYRLTVSSPQESPALPPPLPLAAVVTPLPAKAAAEEKEPNDAATSPQNLTFPADVAGRLDEDWFSFTVDKARTVVAEVHSHRLGEDSDPVMVVHKVTREAKGEEKSSQLSEFDDTAGPAGAERFRTGTRDPSGSIACEPGVTYRIMVTDRFYSGSPYRLVLREAKPDFQVLAMPESPVTDGKTVQRWTSLLRRRGSTVINVALLRRDGFDEPVTLKVSGLPAGVSAQEITLPSTISAGVIILQSTPEVKPWAGRIQITGHAGSLTHPAREVTPRWSVGDTGAERLDMRLSTDGFVLAVTDAEAAPLAVEAPEPRVYESALAGSIELPVKFIRDASLKGFKGEWEAALSGLPGLRQRKPVKLSADAKEAKLVLDLKRKDGNEFQPGTFTCYVTARGTIKWKGDEKAKEKELVEAAWSAPIQIKIEPSPVALTVPSPAVIAPGGKAEITLKVERRFGFNEAVTVELAGPKGVTAEKLTISKDAKEAKLTISAAADAAQGTQQATLNAKCSWNGQEIPWPVKFNLEVKP